jgi:hypothetical protein
MAGIAKFYPTAAPVTASASTVCELGSDASDRPTVVASERQRLDKDEINHHVFGNNIYFALIKHAF